MTDDWLQPQSLPITIEQFRKDPILAQRLREFRHHFGQPPAVRRAFVEAMGIEGP